MPLQHLLTVFAAAETVEDPSGVAVLGINPVAILLQAGTFFLLYLILRRFALKNIVDRLEDRRETIEEGLANAEEAKAQLDASREDAEKLLTQARRQADEVIAKGHEEANSLLEEARGEAAAQTEKMLADAKASIEQDVAEARTALKAETMALVAQAVEVIAGERLDAKKDEALIKRALEKAR